MINTLEPLLIKPIEINGIEHSVNYLNEVQIAIENRFDNRHLKKYVKEIIQEKLNEGILDSIPVENQKLALDILGILAIHVNRLSINALIEILVSRDLVEVNYSAQTIMSVLIELINLDLVEPEQDKSKGRLYVKSNIQLTEEQAEKLDELQYKIPMIVPPLKTNLKGNNKGSGYYTKGSDSLVLNNYHEYDIDSTVLDRLNSIPFSLNTVFMQTIQNSWKCMKELDLEDSIHPDTLMNFDRFEKGVYKTSAILINHGNKFYFTHKYDKRGRIYCCGYHINTQGNSYAKAQLEFANKEIITEEVHFFKD